MTREIGLPAGLSLYRLPIALDTPDIDTGAVLLTPHAGAVLLEARLVVTEAWDSSVSDAIEVGITGNADALVDGADAQATGLKAPGTDGADGVPFLFDGDTDITATVASSGDPGDTGAAVLILLIAETALPA